MKPSPIRAKVAKVLNSREIAINAGSINGVEVGMIFDVLDQTTFDIKDPDTGEVIGSIQRPKVRVKIIDVQARLSIASTFQKKTINIGGKAPSGGFSELFMPKKLIEVPETLKTQEKTWEHLDETESYVKTGDPVIQVIESLE